MSAFTSRSYSHVFVVSLHVNGRETFCRAFYGDDATAGCVQSLMLRGQDFPNEIWDVRVSRVPKAAWHGDIHSGWVEG